MAAVTVSRSEERLIAVKQVPADRAGEVEREADLLKRLNHPGLVRFVDLVETADGGRALHTEFVNSDTWATRALTDPADRAAGMAALAAVVADLHQLGVAHLRITAPHVLHGEDDRPVLCGLTSAAEATPENRHADLAALADLCYDPALGRGALAGKLSSLADAARGGSLSARELARRLDLLAAKRPTGSEPVRAVGGGALSGIRRHFRPKPLIAVGSVAAAVVAAFVLGTRSQGPEPAPTAPAVASSEAASSVAEADPDDSGVASPLEATTPANDPSPMDATGATTEPSRVAAAEPADGLGQINAAGSLNDHGPIETAPDGAFSVSEAAAVLDHGGRRYAVGTTGDFVETGDWDCDGQATVAIVRPSTGGIVLFDGWPNPGETLALAARWSVDSPTGAEAVADGDCDLLRVYTTAGSQLFDPGQAP